MQTFNEQDLKNINELKTFLETEKIEFRQETKEIVFDNGWDVIEEIFYLNDDMLELRYVNCLMHRMDNSKRFGDIQKGIPKSWFGELSKKYASEGKRIIWIKDYEMTECETFIGTEGVELKDYRRKWEVLKSYICCATHHIRYRLYARDTDVCEIDASEARPFLKECCFYGFRGATKTYVLKLKKDKFGLKKGKILMLFSIGHNFYGNKNADKNGVKIEVIRVGTVPNLQVVGGSSKLLKYALENNPSIVMNGVEVPVNKVVFYVDYDHNDSRSLYTLGYEHIGHDVDGFHNYIAKDIDTPKLKAKKGSITQRKPAIHKQIMEHMSRGEIIAIGTAGTDVFELNRDTYLAKINGETENS